MPEMRMFGHRGSSIEEPENTYSSIVKALEECHGAEFDIQQTLDGQFVVLHDETLARTALGWSESNTSLLEHEYYKLLNTSVDQMNFDEFRHVKIGRSHEPYSMERKITLEEQKVEKGQKLSSLPDVLELIKLYPKKQYLIEIKGKTSSSRASLIQRDILESGVDPNQIKLIGFCFDTMVDLKNILPSFLSVLIIYQKNSVEALEAIQKASDANLDGIDMLADDNTVTSEVVTAAHALKLEVLVYVGKEFDNVHCWNKLQNQGVDVFTSDLPPDVFGWMTQQDVLRERTAATLNQMMTTPNQTKRIAPENSVSPHVSSSIIDGEFERPDDMQPQKLVKCEST